MKLQMLSSRKGDVVMTGLKRGTVQLVEHDAEWKRLFAEEKERLAAVLESVVLEIEHIGSTAIPGVPAKPIIDIAVLAPSFEKVQDVIEKLGALGYHYDEPRSSSERYFFSKGEPTSHHLSVTRPGVSYWHRQILFRDYLRSHSDVAAEYAELKRQLAKERHDNLQAYTGGKGQFIQQVLAKAETEE